EIRWIHDAVAPGTDEGFRHADELVIFGGCLVGVPSPWVLRELRRLCRICETHPFRSPAQAIAWAHYYFIRIHPFKDGNGRTARWISAAQLASLTGVAHDELMRKWNERIEDYKNAMQQARA